MLWYLQRKSYMCYKSFNKTRYHYMNRTSYYVIDNITIFDN